MTTGLYPIGLVSTGLTVAQVISAASTHAIGPFAQNARISGPPGVGLESDAGAVNQVAPFGHQAAAAVVRPDDGGRRRAARTAVAGRR